MSMFVTAGIAHYDARLAELEQIAGTGEERARLLSDALAAGCSEVMVLSTCSRIELHAVLDVRRDLAGRRASWAAADRLVGLLLGPHSTGSAGTGGVAIGDLAVHHLFRVAAGLDSRIVGETEVQTQLRLAARGARAQQGEPHRLRRVVGAALSSARTSGLSHPELLRPGLLVERAVQQVLASHADGEPVHALVLGAGTMGRQVVAAWPRPLASATVLSRRATVAVPGGPPVEPLADLPARLPAADAVFVATSAGRQILSSDLVAAVMCDRPGRPLTIVDLSLPRNVDPAVVDVPGVRLLNLDDLSDGVGGPELDCWTTTAVEASTRAAAVAYVAELRSRRAGPTIKELRTSMEETAYEQLRRTTRGLDLPDDVVRRMASAVAGAVAHQPTVVARRAAADDDAQTLSVLCAAFGLSSPITATARVRPLRAVTPSG